VTGPTRASSRPAVVRGRRKSGGYSEGWDLAISLRRNLLVRGMTTADLTAAWELANPAWRGVDEAAWRRRLPRVLAGGGAGLVTFDALLEILRTRPPLRPVLHLIPSLAGWDGERVAFAPGLLRIAVDARRWTLASLVAHAGVDQDGGADVRHGRPLRTSDAARVLRLLAGNAPDRARRAELAHLERQGDPLAGVDVATAFAARRWTSAAAARVAGISPVTAAVVRAGGGSRRTRAAIRDAIHRTPPLPPPPPPPPDPAAPMHPLVLRHEMHRRALDLTSMSVAAGIPLDTVIRSLGGRVRRPAWVAIHDGLARVAPLEGVDEFLEPATMALGRKAGPRLKPQRVADRLGHLGMSPGDFRRATGFANQVAVDVRSGRQIAPATLVRCLAVLEAAQPHAARCSQSGVGRR
jgi:hypothetical protein